MVELEDQLHQYGAWLADRADAQTRAGELPTGTVVEVDAAQARRPRWMVGLAAAVTVVVVGGLAVIVGSRGDQSPTAEPSLPSSTSLDVPGRQMISLGAGSEVPVIGEPVTVEGRSVFQGAPAPPLGVDPETVVGAATELPLEPIEPGEFPVPGDFDEDVNELVAIGRIGRIAMAVHEAVDPSGAMCVLRVVVDDPAGLWLSSCSEVATFNSGVAGTALSWPTLPNDTALVVQLDANGTPERYQLPIANTVVFAPADQDSELVAYDTSGNELDRTRQPVSPSETASSGLAEQAALTWVNITGLNQSDADVWTARLVDVCGVSIDTTGRIRELADEYLSVDIALLPPGAAHEPTIDDAVRAVELVIRSVCVGYTANDQP